MYNSLSNSNFNVKNIIIGHIYYSKHAQLKSFLFQLLSESDLQYTILPFESTMFLSN